jgi:hypothetical protein
MNEQTFVLVDQLRDKLVDTIKGTKTIAGEDTQIKIDVFVRSKLPEIVSLGQSVLADGKISLSEIITIIRFTSELVKSSLDIYSDANITEKLGIVRVIIQFLVSKLLPASPVISYLLNDEALEVLINFVYKFLVKDRK